jgi:hypothetical protein
VALFVTERYIPRGVDTWMAAADERATVAHAGDEPIRHIRTWYLPADETAFSLFFAPSLAALQAAAELGGAKYVRIAEAIDISPNDPVDRVQTTPRATST